MIVRAWLDERWFSRSGNNSWDQLYQINYNSQKKKNLKKSIN